MPTKDVCGGCAVARFTSSISHFTTLALSLSLSLSCLVFSLPLTHCRLLPTTSWCFSGYLSIHMIIRHDWLNEKVNGRWSKLLVTMPIHTYMCLCVYYNLFVSPVLDSCRLEFAQIAPVILLRFWTVHTSLCLYFFLLCVFTVCTIRLAYVLCNLDNLPYIGSVQIILLVLRRFFCTDCRIYVVAQIFGLIRRLPELSRATWWGTNFVRKLEILHRWRCAVRSRR